MRKLRTGYARVDLGGLPSPIYTNNFFTDLLSAWNLVAHKYVTEPRRELSRRKSLMRYSSGDLLVIEEDGSRKAASAVAQTFIGDRGLQELIIDESLSTVELNSDLLDKVIVYFDEYNESLRRKERKFEVFEASSRLERKFIIDRVKNVGFNFFSDRLSTEAYWRISQNTGLYRAEASTKESVKFLSWLINADFEVEYLWTSDGIRFSRKQVIQKTHEDGFSIYVGQTRYFPTSHVLLKYNAEKSPYINIQKMQELFLKQAPINVVLSGILAQINPFEVFATTVIGSFSRQRYMTIAR